MAFDSRRGDGAGSDGEGVQSGSGGLLCPKGRGERELPLYIE